MKQSYNDQEIIEAFRQGGLAREKAWEYAFKAWRDRIYGVIIGKNGTKEEAKDAMQDIAMAFERRVKSPDFVLQHQLSTYFISCVYRQWIRRRKASTQETTELEDRHLAGFVDSVEASIAQRDLAAILDESLSAIGDRCKAILRLFMNGFSMKEIAAQMGFNGEQVAKNEKSKCQGKYENYLREHPGILEHIQLLRNG